MERPASASASPGLHCRNDTLTYRDTTAWGPSRERPDVGLLAANRKTIAGGDPALRIHLDDSGASSGVWLTRGGGDRRRNTAVRPKTAACASSGRQSGRSDRPAMAAPSGTGHLGS